MESEVKKELLLDPPEFEGGLHRNQKKGQKWVFRGYVGGVIILSVVIVVFKETKKNSRFSGGIVGWVMSKIGNIANHVK